MRAWLAWWLLLTGLYLVLVDTRRIEEIVTAAVVGGIGAAAAILVRQGRDVVLRPHPRSAARELRTLASWPRDLVLLSRALVRRPRGRVVEIPFDAEQDPARTALAIAGRSLAPNRIVIDADGERDLLVYHELVER